VEIVKAAITFKGIPDPLIRDALVHAVNRAKNEGHSTLEGVAKAIDDARKEIQAANSDGNTKLSVTEQKKVKTVMGRSLLGFAYLHAKDKLSDFSWTPEKIYVPSRPFRAPYRATAGEHVQALVKHFNAFSNDNKGAGANNISRFVMGDVEAGGMAKEIEKLSPTFGRAVLRALEDRIQQDPNAIGDPQRVYLSPSAQDLMDAVAKKFRVRCDFAGDPRPPQFDYY
jgi:hypothetical protein